MFERLSKKMIHTKFVTGGLMLNTQLTPVTKYKICKQKGMFLVMKKNNKTNISFTRIINVFIEHCICR